jgi:hypothetical protein
MGPEVTKDSKRRAGLPQVPHARLSSCFGITWALDGEDPMAVKRPGTTGRCWGGSCVWQEQGNRRPFEAEWRKQGSGAHGPLGQIHKPQPQFPHAILEWQCYTKGLSRFTHTISTWLLASSSIINDLTKTPSSNHGRKRCDRQGHKS